LKYDLKKRQREARKKQTIVKTKEIKISPRIDEHDLQVKINQARNFLQAGNKVKVTVRFRGREVTHKGLGEDKCTRIRELCKDLAQIEIHPKMEGRDMTMLLAPMR